MIVLTKRHLIPLFCLCLLCVVFSYSTYNAIPRQANIKSFQLDNNIQQQFLTIRLVKDLVLINISKHKIMYFYEGINNLRLEPLLAELQQIVYTQPGSIPDGNYFISLHDGIQRPTSIPLLAFAANKNLVQAKHVILIPDYTAIQGHEKTFKQIDKQAAKYPWQKRIPKIFWRGATTGATRYITDIEQFSRGKFLQQTKQLSYVNAGFTTYTRNLTPALQKELHSHFPKQKIIPPEDAIVYRYLLDIDGNSCSYSRMAWILYSKSLLLKQSSDNIQWYYKQLQPFVHYVPLKNDFSDLKEKFTWLQQHPLSSMIIASNARQLAEEIFTASAIRATIINAFNEYHAILQSRL